MRRSLNVALGVLASGWLAACGAGSPSAPAPPPAPASLGFLHVLQGSSVVTYPVAAATGRLGDGASQVVGDAHTIAGEPQGRYVYAAFGPRSAAPPYNGTKPSIVAYAPDTSRGGTLTSRFEASSDPIWHSSEAVQGHWYWLSATSTRIYAMWATITYHDVYNTLVTHAAGSDGRLGPASHHDFYEEYPSGVTIDVDSGVFYKAGERDGLTAYSVQPDGQLTTLGASRQCAASTFSTIAPLAGVRGFLFAYGVLERTNNTTCSWEGPSLAPRSNLGLRATHAASTPTLVAMRIESPPRLPGQPEPPNEVRLFSMSADGDLALRDTVTGPGYTKRLLFHPSGRFLYASHAPSGGSSRESLIVYAIDAQGHLALVQSIENGGGAMAATLPLP